MIEQGDTLFGIALDYGVSVDALVSANGLDLDDFLRIGQALIIPLEEETGASAPGSAPVSRWLLPTPTPLPLSTSSVALYETPVGGLWCMGEVVNTSDEPVTNLQVRVTLVAQDGTPLLSSTTLAAADYLMAQGRAPFALLFGEPPEGVADVQVSLVRAESMGEITAAFVPLTVLQPEGAVSGPQYRVSGLLHNDSTGVVRRISIVVTLYDTEGAVVGYRHAVLDKTLTLPSGQRHEFALLLTYRGMDPPAAFQVLAWAVRDP